MQNITMCPYCNDKHIKEFEKLLEEKNIKLNKDCIGQCEKNTPVCLVDDKVIEVDTVSDLVTKLSLEVKS